MTSQAARNSPVFGASVDGAAKSSGETPQVTDALYRQMMDGALDLFDQGVTVFDVELRLIAWNRRFAEMLEFPPELLRAGTHYEAFVRYNLARGEYGEYGEDQTG